MNEDIPQPNFIKPNKYNVDRTRTVPIKHLLNQLVEEKHEAQKKEETNKVKKKWNWPFRWKSTMNKSIKQKDFVVVLYFNIKGEIEPPMLLPLYSGNMVIVRNKVYEVDPRAFWMIRNGMKTVKVLAIKEIDRRPISNLDYSEIKLRGDATDSDEFLIKAALKAQTVPVQKKPVNTTLLIVIGIIAVVGVGIFFFMS